MKAAAKTTAVSWGRVSLILSCQSTRLFAKLPAHAVFQGLVCSRHQPFPLERLQVSQPAGDFFFS